MLPAQRIPACRTYTAALVGGVQPLVLRSITSYMLVCAQDTGLHVQHRNNFLGGVHGVCMAAEACSLLSFCGGVFSRVLSGVLRELGAYHGLSTRPVKVLVVHLTHRCFAAFILFGCQAMITIRE